jgi:hexosaminidase
MRQLRWIAALSLALNVAGVALFAARRLLRPAPLRALDEQARAAMFHGMTDAKRDVVVLGDSLVQRGEWWELLGRPVANRGISSDTVADVEARLDDVVALEPQVLFLLVGVNDLSRGTSPEALVARHARLVAELRRRLPQTRIVVESLLPIRDELASGRTSATVRRVNELLRPTAGADWLDLHAKLEDAHGELEARYSFDGVHLTAAGYRVWADALRPYLP